MCLSTVDHEGWPDSRMVLLKGLEDGGFVFYTHLTSTKGRQLLNSPKAALLFHWKSLRRQIRIRGVVERVSDAEADSYFATRARQSQIGAWASRQSSIMSEPMALEAAVAREALRFGLGNIPRPEHWSGFRLIAKSFEFWSDRPFRLHERLQYDFNEAAQSWSCQRLFP
jgi:pyridoxamine 5'-phosphate oxidase